jgi:hypothetical protein
MLAVGVMVEVGVMVALGEGLGVEEAVAVGDCVMVAEGLGVLVVALVACTWARGELSTWLAPSWACSSPQPVKITSANKTSHKVRPTPRTPRSFFRLMHLIVHLSCASTRVLKGDRTSPHRPPASRTPVYMRRSYLSAF